ncbi:hypothetical protein ACHAPU_004813 [Fusarium lateritium]
MSNMDSQWQEEAVASFVANADSGKTFNSKPSKDLPVWKKEEKKASEPSQSCNMAEPDVEALLKVNHKHQK